MNENDQQTSSPRSRVARPEMLIALSAVVVGVCALFVSIYETSLMRKQQQASVWPHLAVAYSHQANRFAFMVINLGIGPARIQDVEVTVDGEAVADWSQMIDRLDGQEAPRQYMISSFNHIVVPAGSEYKVFWVELDEADDPATRSANARLLELLVGNLDRIGIAICYSSVYGDCWRARLGISRPEEVAPKNCSFGPGRSFGM